MNMRSLAAVALFAAAMGVAVETEAVARAARFPTEAACTSVPRTAPIYAPAREQVAQTPGGPIGYYRFGRGTPLVLVTGFRATISEWDAGFLADLARRHDVVVFDNRGIGLSIPNAASFTVQDMARDTAALIEALKLDRPTVLGWSMGGSIVQQLAIENSDLVGRIVLMSTLPPGAAGVPVPPEVLSVLSGAPGVTFNDVMAELFPKADVAQAVRCFRKEMYRPRGYAPPTISDAVTTAQTALLAAWAADDAAAAALKQVRIPAFVVSGAQDAVASIGNAQALEGLLPNSRLLTVDNAGHAMMYQYPAPLAREITSFIER